MAGPFGGHPTLLQYLDWAEKAGCTVRYGLAVVTDSGMQRVMRIKAQSGRYVIVTGMQDDEILVPTYVHYLDRRLGLVSGFASVGPTDD